MKTFVCVLFALASMVLAVEPKFRTQEIDSKVGVGYGLQLADMNGDKKTDIILCDKDKVVWYENPTWKKHQISGHLTKRDHVCIAARDLDGDGKAEIAVGAQWNIGETSNDKTSGSIFYLNPTANREGNWKPIRLPHEPTTHRMHWIKSGKGKFDLIVKPLHGRGNSGGKGKGINVYAYRMPKNPADEWKRTLVSNFMHDSHNFHPIDWNGDGREEFLQAGLEGVYWFGRDGNDKWKYMRFTSNYAGEVRDGRTPTGKRFITTIEPKHGSTVVVYLSTNSLSWERRVLDESLKDGHALATGDFLGTGGDQVVAGWRGMTTRGVPGVRLYVPQNGTYSKWKTYQLSGKETAVEDIKAGDLNGDGKPEIIVACRQTHNLRILWNESK
jgi:hypothetical protein